MTGIGDLTENDKEDTPMKTWMRTHWAALLAPGRARRATFLARREELNAACEADPESETQNDHPLYLALADHCESRPWRDAPIITWIDVRDSWRRVRAATHAANRQEVWDIIATRIHDDAPTDDIVDALVAHGWINLDSRKTR